MKRDDDLDRDLREEIETHLRMRAEHSAIGEQRARKQFGNKTQIQEEMRSMHISPYLDELMQDLRYASRRALRMPGFTFAILAAIAVGIGASSAVFSVVDRILFRPLPYAHEEQLVWLGMTAPIAGGEDFLLGGDYLDWKDQQQVFSHFTASQGVEACDVTEDNPVRLRCMAAATDYLETFGYAPVIGRNLQRGEDQHVLISHALWQARYNGRRDVLNETIQLNGKPWRIAGVLPADFEIPSLARVDLVTPLGLDETSERARTGRVSFLKAWARLKPGVSLRQADAALQPLFRQSLKYVPPSFVKEVKLVTYSLRERQARNSRIISLTLLAAVLAVLLIACANVTNLLLARAAASEREAAIRAAIGASRARLVRQTLTESLLLTFTGGVLGLLLGNAFLKIAASLAPAGIPRLQNATLDARVLAFTLAITLLCGLLCGVIPSLRTASVQALTGARSTSVHSWTRPALVTVQIALASALLYSASLLSESLWKLQETPLGIATNNLISTSVSLRDARYAQTPLRDDFWNRLDDQIARLPGVTSYAFSDSLPPSGRAATRIFARMRIDGKPEDVRGGTGGMVLWRSVTPAYFKTMGIALRQGRVFTTAEDAKIGPQQPPALVLSERLARKLFGTPDAAGRLVKPGPDAPWSSVVGVVGDAKNNGFEPDDPEFYAPLSRQSGRANLILAVRTSANPALMRDLMRNAITALDSHIPLTFETMEQRTSQLTEGPRFNTAVLGFFSLAGLLLGATGIYSVVSFLVSQRTKEIGIRLALGASAQSIRQLILRNAIVWTLAGCGAGTGLVALGLPYLKNLLYQTPPTRPWTAGAVLAGMAAVAILASLVPAIRAARLDPIQTLRHD